MTVGGMPMGGRGTEGGGMGMTLNPADTANLATVEIQGLVYIYMPPDPAILTVPGDDDADACRRRRGGGSVKGVASREFRVARKMQQRHRESLLVRMFQLVTRNS